MKYYTYIGANPNPSRMRVDVPAIYFSSKRYYTWYASFTRCMDKFYLCFQSAIQLYGDVTLRNIVICLTMCMHIHVPGIVIVVLVFLIKGTKYAYCV